MRVRNEGEKIMFRKSEKKDGVHRCSMCAKRLEPRKAWLDDEEGACLCDRCLKKYNRTIGKPINRKSRGVEDGTQHYIWAGYGKIILD